MMSNKQRQVAVRIMGSTCTGQFVLGRRAFNRYSIRSNGRGQPFEMGKF